MAIPVCGNEAIMDLIRSFGMDPSNVGDSEITAKLRFPISGVAEIELHCRAFMTEEQINLLKKAAAQWPVRIIVDSLNLDRGETARERIEFMRPGPEEREP